MHDYYEILGLESKASAEEIETAFRSTLETRQAKRQRTSDVHVAHAVLSDSALRHAYDAARIGVALVEKVNDVRTTTMQAASQASELIPDIDFKEVASQAWQTTLKATVLTAGVAARAGEVASVLSRRLQVAAAKQLAPETDGENSDS